MGRHAKWADLDDDEDAHVDLASVQEISKEGFGTSYEIVEGAPGCGEWTMKANFVGNQSPRQVAERELAEAEPGPKEEADKSSGEVIEHEG